MDRNDDGIHGIITQKFTTRNHSAINVVFCSSPRPTTAHGHVDHIDNDNDNDANNNNNYKHIDIRHVAVPNIIYRLRDTQSTIIGRGRVHCVQTRFTSVNRERDFVVVRIEQPTLAGRTGGTAAHAPVIAFTDRDTIRRARN